LLFQRNPTRPGMWIAVGLLAGGAIGNLADRVRADAVTDYIQLPHWPAFNLADIAVTVGVIILALAYLREREPEDEGA
jgi:signal peptidase II